MSDETPAPKSRKAPEAEAVDASVDTAAPADASTETPAAIAGATRSVLWMRTKLYQTV